MNTSGDAEALRYLEHALLYSDLGPHLLAAAKQLREFKEKLELCDPLTVLKVAAQLSHSDD